MIYEDVNLYAKECRISLEQAKIRCEHFLGLQRETEKAKVCPMCKQHSLEIESDGCEFQSQSWIMCDSDDCEFTDDEQKEKYIPLQIWYGFDEVLAIACSDMKHGIRDWEAFVEKSTQELTK
ncbi:hypothetical protein [Bacillus mycoides]|uniref:hypothetical protein n=1 Tax=Bacillus mycoides TaxID=1405 RepID=UPI003A80B131